MMRLAAAALAAVLLLAPARAQIAGETPLTVDQFDGQNNYIDSARLKPSAAVSAVNVLTEHGYIERRPGSAQVGSFPGAVENMAEFVKASGARVLVGHTANSLYSTDLGSPAAVISTVAANGKSDFVVAYNKIIEVDGAAESEYDGASTTTSAGFPGCQFVEFMLNRIWCAKITTESNSIVRISSVGASTYWTVPASPSAIPDAPNFFYIQRDDGYPITCLKKTPWGMVVGKRRSMWVIKGTDNTNWYVRAIDSSIGCVDDRTMQMVDGRLQWLAVDGVYSWEGGAIRLESLEIESTIKSLRQSAAQGNSWAVDSQSDFLSGILNGNGPGALMSATILPGSVVGSTWGVTELGIRTTDWAMVDVDTTVLPTSTFVSNNDSATTLDSTWTVTGGNYVNSNHTITDAFIANVDPLYASNSLSTGVWSFTFQSTATGTSGAAFWFVSQNRIDTTSNPGPSYQFRLFTTSFGLGNYNFGKSNPAGGVDTIASSTGSATCSNPYDGSLHTYIVTRSTNGFMSAYCDGSFVLSASNVSFSTTGFIKVNMVSGVGDAGRSHLGAVKWPQFYENQHSIPYYTGISTNVFGIYSAVLSSSSVSSVTFNAQFSSAPLGPYTSYYAQTNGQVFTAQSSTLPYIRSGIIVSAPSSTFTALSVSAVPLSAATYGVRAGTYSFSATDTSIAWSTQTAAATVNLAVSTPTYVQWRVLTGMANATNAPSIQLVRINWNSGDPTASAASAFLNHRYLLCVAISSAVNDTCLIQQRTRTWVTMTGQYIGALTLYNNDIYGGSANSDGKVWRELQDALYTDDGNAINSSWETPDMLLGDPVSKKVLSDIWIDAQTSTNTLLNVGYAVDKSTTYISKTINLGMDPTVVNRRVPIDAGRVWAKYLKFKFSNSQPNPLRINGFTIFTTDQPRDK